MVGSSVPLVLLIPHPCVYVKHVNTPRDPTLNELSTMLCARFPFHDNLPVMKTYWTGKGCLDTKKPRDLRIWATMRMDADGQGLSKVREYSPSCDSQDVVRRLESLLV